MAIRALRGNICGMLLCLIPTSVHGISPDFMLEASVRVCLFDIERTYVPASAFQASLLHRSWHVKLPLPLWGPSSLLALEISFLVTVLRKVLLQTLILFSLDWKLPRHQLILPCWRESLNGFLFSKMCLNVLWLFTSLCLIYHCKLSNCTKLSAGSQSMLLLIYSLLFLYYFHLIVTFHPTAGVSSFLWSLSEIPQKAWVTPSPMLPSLCSSQTYSSIFPLSSLICLLSSFAM